MFCPVALVFSFVFGYCLCFRDNLTTPATYTWGVFVIRCRSSGRRALRSSSAQHTKHILSVLRGLAVYAVLPVAKNHDAVQALSLRTSPVNIQQKLLPFLQGGSSHHGSANEFKRSRSDSVTSAGSNGSAHRRGVNLDHHSMNAHRRPLEEFLTALRKV